MLAGLGADLPRRASTGDVVTIGVGDVSAVAASLAVTGPGVGGSGAGAA